MGMNKYAIQRRYRDVVLLDSIRGGSHPEELKNSAFLRQELGVMDLPAVYRHLVKEGLCVKCGGGTYELTDAGREYLEQQDDLVRFFYFASPYIDVTEYCQARSAREEASFEELMLELSEKRFGELMAKRAYQEAQGVLFDSGCLHEMAGKSREAFVRYEAALLMAVRGMEYAALVDEVRTGKKDVETARRAYTGVNIQPKIIEGLIRLKDVYKKPLTATAIEMVEMQSVVGTDVLFRQLVYNILFETYDYMLFQGIFRRDYYKTLNAIEKELKNGSGEQQ